MASFTPTRRTTKPSLPLDFNYNDLLIPCSNKLDDSFTYSLPSHDYRVTNLKYNEMKITEHLELNINICTYNLGGISSNDIKDSDILNIIKPDNKKLDILIIGLQEVVPLDVSSLLSNHDYTYKLWCDKINNLLGIDEYKLLIYQDLYGLLIIDIYASNIGVGLLGLGNNKGSTAIRFKLYNSTLCFINSHLAAHQNDYKLRNSDYKEIINNLNFISICTPPKTLKIKDHDYVWFFGDLNYRVDMSCADILLNLERKDYDSIIEYDQLNCQKKLMNAFVGFEEPKICFPPTYKYQIGTNDYSITLTKPPSYCDRILYLPHPPSEITNNDDSSSFLCAEYTSIDSVNCSDHKPVRAKFVVPVRFTIIEKEAALKEKINLSLNQWHCRVKEMISHSPIEEDFKLLEDSKLLRLKTGLSNAASSASKITSGMANGLSYLSADKNFIDAHHIATREEEKGVLTGMKNFGLGVANGFSELFSKPYEGANKSGASGFFKGLAQGIGGLVAKPTAGLFDMASHSFHAAATSSIDAEITSIIPLSRLSLDGYIRLVLYQKCQKIVIPTSQSGGNSSLTSESRILNLYEEFMLLSVRLNFNKLAIVCTNYRMLIFPIPMEFEREISSEILQEVSKTKASLDPITITCDNSNSTANFLNLFLLPKHGTKSILCYVDEKSESLIIEVIFTGENQKLSAYSYKITCFSVYEANFLQGLLSGYFTNLSALNCNL